MGALTGRTLKGGRMGHITFGMRRVDPLTRDSQTRDPLTRDPRTDGLENWRITHRGSAGPFGDVEVLHGAAPRRVAVRGEKIPQAVLTHPRVEARAGGVTVPKAVSLIVGGQSASLREAPARRRTALYVDVAGRHYVRRFGGPLMVETQRQGIGVLARLVFTGRAAWFRVPTGIDDVDLAMVLVLAFGVRGMRGVDPRPSARPVEI